MTQKVLSREKRKILKDYLLPKCQKGFKLGIARCYKPCKGFKGVGALLGSL